MMDGRGGSRKVDRPRYLLVGAVAVFNVLGAGFGAVGLASGWLALDPPAMARLPWGSGVLAGIALAVVVAVPNAVVVVVAGRRQARCGPASIAAGVLLMGWIAVELAFIRELSFFHPTYLAIGLVQVWLGVRVVRESTGITGRDLWREVRNVLVDVPVFLTSPLYRRWHLTWNATTQEVDSPMPGDELLLRPSYASTRAIIIDAPPEKVWPWLLQVGCLPGRLVQRRSPRQPRSPQQPDPRPRSAAHRGRSAHPNVAEADSGDIVPGRLVRRSARVAVDHAGQYLGVAADRTDRRPHPRRDPHPRGPRLATTRWSPLECAPARVRRLRDAPPHAEGHQTPLGGESQQRSRGADRPGP